MIELFTLFSNTNNNDFWFYNMNQDINDLFIQGKLNIFLCNESIEKMKKSAPLKYKIIRKLVDEGGILFPLSSYLIEKAFTNDGKDFKLKHLHMSFIFKFLCLTIAQECINPGIQFSAFRDMGSAFYYANRYINAFLLAANNPKNKDELQKTNKEALEKCIELGVTNKLIKEFLLENSRNNLLQNGYNIENIYLYNL